MAGVGGMGIGVVNAILVRARTQGRLPRPLPGQEGLAIRNGGVYSQITFVKDDGTAAAPTYATTGNIPYGRADLLLGIDILEAARAIDPREQFRVASPGKTCAVLNTFKQPTVYGLLGRQDFDPDALREEIFAHCRHDQSFARNLSDLCEQRLAPSSTPT